MEFGRAKEPRLHALNYLGIMNETTREDGIINPRLYASITQLSGSPNIGEATYLKNVGT